MSSQHNHQVMVGFDNSIEKEKGEYIVENEEWNVYNSFWTEDDLTDDIIFSFYTSCDWSKLVKIADQLEEHSQVTSVAGRTIEEET